MEILVLVVIVLLVILFAASLAPIVPMRRRQGAGRVPLVTLAILLVNILLFLAYVKGFALPNETGRAFGLIANHASLVTLLTHMFFHGDYLHLIGNMLGLWFFGPHVEEAVGRREYLLLYLGAGFAGGLMQVAMTNIFMPATAHLPMIGASGALFGVLGVFALRFWRTKVRVLIVFPVPAILAVGAFALLALVSGVRAFATEGVGEGVANWAHVGGFLFGAGMAGLMRLRDDSKHEYELEDAEKAVQKGNLDKGAAHYRTLLEDKPDDADARLALARICVQQRQSEAAHRHYVEAIRLYLRSNLPAAAKAYEEAVSRFAIFPLPADMLARVASACETMQMFPLTLRALSELCREYPDAKESELGLLRLGKLHLQKLNQPQSAVGIFQEFIRVYPASEWNGHVAQLLDEAQVRAAL